MKIKPAAGRYVVRITKEEEVSEGGIVMVDMGGDHKKQALTVIVEEPPSNGEYGKNVVLFVSKYAGTPLGITKHGQPLLVIQKADILGHVDD